MANITNKRSFVHRANRNMDGEPDTMLKWKLMKVLRNKFGISSRTGPKIAIHRKYGYVKQQLTKEEVPQFYLHDPDVTSLKHNPPLIFEIDGDVHFLTKRGIKQTNSRNEHYELAVFNGKHPRLIWITRAECELSDERLGLILYEKFRDHGIKLSSS